MSRECEDCNKELTSAYEKIEILESNNEDLKYFYKDLLNNYAKVCSSEGLGDFKHIEQIWLKYIENL